MCCLRIAIASFNLSLYLVVMSARYDEDYTTKCKADFKKLKETKIAVSQKKGEVVTKTDVEREVDGMGYVLMVEEKTQSYTITKSGIVNKNLYSLWAIFKCKGDKLVHDHCRLGRSVDRERVFIHPRRYFDTRYDNHGPDDGFTYGCNVDDGKMAATEAAEVAPTFGGEKSYMINHMDDKGCQPIMNSDWCGFASGIVENGCLDGMDSKQKSEIYSNGHGYIVIQNKETEKRMQLQVICEDKKFTIQACNPENYLTVTLQPGECFKEKGLAYACPKKNKGHTFQQLAAVVQIAALTKAGGVPDKLNCFKEIP